MKIKKGNNRIVFTFPKLGFVIKLPVINWFKAFKPVLTWKVGGIKSRRMLIRYFQWPVEASEGFKNYLFRGFLANIAEYKFYKKTKHSFLKPTYFSLFGLFNIQKYGPLCELGEIDFWCQLYALTDGDVFADGHHFASPHNFSLEDKLQMLDYGSKRTHKVIIEHGDNILKNFDPSYSWDVEKEKIEYS